MKNLFTFLLLVMLAIPVLALADGYEQHDEEDNGLAALLEERRKGTILPLYVILREVAEITGDRVVEIEFERDDGIVKYGIYYLTIDGLRREIYVDARTGVVLEEKAAD